MLQIFDIQRFALHDGPGIRTTVFVKGCPLKCEWCHNPESQSFQPQMACVFNKCTSCGRCAQVCPVQAHTFINGEHRVDFAQCIVCEACKENCFHSAINRYGRSVETSELLDAILPDRAFFENSGGGLTVSGGEPLSQPDGLIDLLKSAREAGIHTCLDTSGFAPQQVLDRVSPYVDLFLFDYKATGEELHRKLTGVSGQAILRNLEHLNEQGKQVWLRCPIIPGKNDTEEHFRAIAALCVKYSAIRQVNVMAYHDMAKGKTKQIGQSYRMEDTPSVTKEEKARYEEKLLRYGCEKLAPN